MNPSDPENLSYSNSSSSKGDNREPVDPYNSSFGMTLGKSIQDKTTSDKAVKQDSPSKSLPKSTNPEIFGTLDKEQKVP